ncbi:hypothetical protein CIK05_11360 [Bdellovibrio sp. qaytius]|nr:hypothetical protein CIK05_11360 [Bdellovibrio sp. qaytius]
MPSKHNFIILFVSFLSLTALGAETSPHCYWFKPGSVEAVEHDADTDVPDAETWCYQRVESPQPGTYIFNIDQGVAKPETALFKGDDGYLVHSSLLAGKITTHRVKATDFNPYSIPLEEPNITQLTSIVLTPKTISEARTVLSNLLISPRDETTPAIKEGTFTAQADVLPWRGYWFPQRGQPITVSMKKYDLFVKARTGKSPNSAGYERIKHAWGGEVWEGHCNGWAAASILNEEPVAPQTDPLSKTTFSVLDQKALMIERDFCVTHAFFGSRYRGPGDNASDIRPALFYKTLTYYIGQLGKPVATDYDSHETVNNAVISGYTMTITKTASKTFRVNSVVTLHHYDKTKSDEPGVARSEQKKYNFSIRVNDAGEIIGGNWLTGNPDFLWVPLSHSACGNNNNKIEPIYIEQILNLSSTPNGPTRPTHP